MTKSCLNPTDSRVIAMVDANRAQFPQYKDNQILTLGNLYYDKFKRIPTPKQLIDFKADLDIQSSKEGFDKKEITAKDDVLDIMQSLFFGICNKALKGKTLTKDLINKNQAVALAHVKKVLAKHGLVDIVENFDSYAKLLASTRLKQLHIDLDLDVEDREHQASKDNIWDKDSTMTNNYENASDEAIYMFASLVSNDTIRELPKPYNFSLAWTQTQNLLSGTSDIDTQVKLLRASNLPFKDQLLSKLGYADYDSLNENDFVEIRTSFLKSFAKSGNALSKSSPGKATINTIEETLKQSIKQRWRSNFLGSDFAKLVGTKRTINPEKYEELDNATGQEFARMLGIDITEWDDKLLNNEITLIKEHFYNKQIKEGEALSWLDESKAVTKSLKVLLDYQSKFELADRPLGARNAQGEYQHSIGNHSYFSKKIGQLRDGLLQAKTTFEYLFANGRAIMNIDQGMTGNKDAKSFSELAKGEMYISMISDMFSSQPIIHVPRTADKTSEKGIQLPYSKQLAQGKTIKEYFNQYMAYTEIGDHLYERLYNQYKADTVKKSIESVGFTNKTYKPPVTFWNEILGLESTLEPSSRKSFIGRVDKYIKDQLPDLYADLKKYGVVEEPFSGKFKIAFAESFLGESLESKTKEQQKAIIDNLLSNYIFNSLMFGTEITNFTMGSLTTVAPADFFKRTAGPIAEGTQPRSDASFIEWLDASRPDYMSHFPSSSIMRVMIAAEDLVVSPNAKEYNEAGDTDAYGLDSKGKPQVNTDDAQGKILFEVYRAYNLSIKQWTKLQEEAYQKIIAGKPLTSDFNTLFPPLKPVGYSLVKINGVDVPIYLKTSLYPVHKQFSKGTLNESAYDSMIKNGVSMILPKSGIKLAHPTNLQDQFKDNEFVFNPDAIIDFPLEDFRNQLEIAMKDSFKQLIGTQQQKLIASNMYENGKIINEDFTDWTRERTATMQQISNLELEKLKKKADIDIVNGIPQINNYNKLKTMLKDELMSRNLPLNTIEAINELIDEDGNLISTIDTLPSRQKLMNLLNSIVTNNLIKINTNGAALVQVAQTGWELKKITKEDGSKVTDEDIIAIDSAIQFINDEAKVAYYRNNGLKFLDLGETKKEKVKEKPINIYAGNKENAELSNFAERPVTNAAGVTYKTVEGAFQAAKLKYATGNNDGIDFKLQNATGAEAKKLGNPKSIKGLNVEAWDKNSTAIMKDLIKESFLENPEALEKLLATGNAQLTHKVKGVEQDKGRFSKVLMEVRTELGGKSKSSGQKTGAAEILLPNKFRHLVGKDGTIDPKALVSIGYRIPTQGLNSILHLKVIGFLPAGLDQVVVMPREITTQGGSDFDVDKLNIFVPNVIDGKYISSDANAEEAYEKRKTKLENFRKYLQSGIDATMTNMEDRINNADVSEIYDLTEKFENTTVGDILKDNGYEEDTLEEIVAKIQRESQEEFKQDWIRRFELKKLQNKLIEQSLKVLEHEASVKSLLTPNSAKDLKSLSEKYKTRTDLKASDMFKPKTLVDISEQMYSSKSLVAVFASQITHHVLSQQVGLHFKPGRPFYFNHNKINGMASLSGVTNVNGALITDRLGNQYCSAAVDGAKDPFLFDLGCNIDTGVVFALFERMGGDVEILVKLIKQPIVQDFLLEMSNNKQLSVKKELSKINIIEMVLARQHSNKANSEYATEFYNKTTKQAEMLSTLRERRNDFGDWERNLTKLASQLGTKDHADVQTMVLDDFLYLMDAARIASESIQTSKFDTKGPGKDVLQSLLLDLNYEKFKEKMAGEEGYRLGTIKDGVELPYDRLITDTLLDVFSKTSAKFTMDLYKDLVLLMKNGYIKQLISEFNNGDGEFVTRKLDEESSTLLYGSTINYILQNDEGLDSSLFFGESTVARKILDIQKDPEHPLHGNYLFSNVFNPEIGDGESVPDITSLQNKSIDPKEADFILKSFGELKEDDIDLYNKLIKINFFQTGVVQSPVSFYGLIPYNDVLPITNRIINNHTAIVNHSSKENLEDNLMANVGMKMNNIRRVKWKTGDKDFGTVITLPLERNRGKKYILYSQNRKVKKAVEGNPKKTISVWETKQGIFKQLSENTYYLLDPQNYKYLFYNLTNAKMTMLDVDTEVETEEEVNETSPAIPVKGKTPWENLSTASQARINKVGITDIIFNKLTEEEQKNVIKCHG